MQQIRDIFFRGLVTFLPIAVTVYILYTGVLIMENLLGGIIRSVIPETYIPGLGFLITIGVVFMFGLMLNNFLIGELLQRMERRLQSIPLIKAVYSPLRDLMNLFSKKGQQDMKSVVLVDLGNGMQALGLVTRESFRDLPEMKTMTEGKVAVYIPWSYGLGGLTFLVPRSHLSRVDIPVDRALSLSLTAWVKSHDLEQPETPKNG